MPVAFTPIIPHPATDCNTINTTMVNLQNFLSQKGLDHSQLWRRSSLSNIKGAAVAESCSVWQHLLRDSRFSF